MFIDRRLSPTMRERKKLGFSLDIKSIEDSGVFAGYASVFGMVDNQRDVMLKGAFSRTLKGRVGDIKLLWQHQQDEPIGVFTEIAEDANGLYVEGKLLLQIQRAKEAHALLKEGAISGLSIGYSPVRYTIDEKTWVRKLAEVELWEISLVTFPANDAAQVTVVKQMVDREWGQLQQGGQLVALSEALDRAIDSLRF